MDIISVDREQLVLMERGLVGRMRGSLRDPGDNSVLIAIAYCMLLDKLFGDTCEDPFAVEARFIDDGEVRYYLKDALSKVTSAFYRDMYPSLKHEYSTDALASFILDADIDRTRGDDLHSTPVEVCELALRLLSAKQDSRIVDFCSGTGTFMMMAAAAYPGSQITGIEKHHSIATLSRIRMSIPIITALAAECGDSDVERKYAVSLSLRHDVRIGDMLALAEPDMCDYAFSNYPCGLRTASLDRVSEFADKAVSGKLGYSRPVSADWVFNHLLVNSLSEGGRAVAIMSGGACYNTTDEGARRYFIEKGLIESVIALPPRLFPGIGIGFTILVLSRGNDRVTVVDASDLHEVGRRTNTLSPDAADKVEERLANDIEGYSRTVNREEMASTGYALAPAMYLQRPVSIKNARRLGDVVLEVRRGAAVRANELDDLSVNEATDCQYLMLRDIQDGVISDDLPFLGELDKRLESHCIEDGDVLVSKNGAPFKVAVAEIPEGKKVLANGNLYMLRVDRDVIDPYYLAAFLSSNKGREVLSRAVVGVTIPSIPLRNLREIPVPVPEIEEQWAIAEEYQAKLDEIRVLKMRVQRAIDEALALFDGEE